MARTYLGAVTGGLRTGISAGSCGLSPCLPALGLAAVVLHRRIAGAAYLVRARKSKRTRSLAPLAHRLDDLPTRHIPQLEALRLSRSATGYDEFHFSRHSGYVPDSLTATTWLQSAAHVGLHGDFDDRGALRRGGGRGFILRSRAAAHPGDGGGAWEFGFFQNRKGQLCNSRTP